MGSNCDCMSSDSTRSGAQQALPARQNGCLTTAGPTWLAESRLDLSTLENDIIEIDRANFEAQVEDSSEDSNKSDTPGPQSLASDSPTESLLLAIPPELRLNIYSFLLLTFSNSIKTTVLKLIRHGTIRYYAFLPQLEIFKDRQRLLQHSGICGILETHPLIRHEILPMYRNSLPIIWKDHTTLAMGNADRYLELLTWGYYEPGSREVLEFLDELSKGLANSILNELCSIGSEQLTHKQKVRCREVTKTWKGQRTLVGRFDEPGWRQTVAQLSMHENQRKPVEAMMGNVRFVGTIVGAVEFR